ncbi:MAG: CCA tRNA nucleotidyltransferase [Cyanobacteriota bacterium]|nr:CCA tRNA nucleotidyltransferase [Cyanobacteriota bacterium]
MPADAPDAPILTADPQLRLAQLRERLAPWRWPLPTDALPPGSALVGGAVRDALLDRLADKPDLDLIVPDDGVVLGQRLARQLGGSCVALDPDRGIGRWIRQGWTIDLARREGDSLVSDLARRDYSVNAIALPLTAESGLLDPHQGQEDLRAGRLRALGEANLLADPLRLLRGPRLAAELGLQLEPQTEVWIRHHAARLGDVAGERVLAELERLAATAAGGLGLEQVLEWGLLAPWCGAGGAGLPAPGSLDGRRAQALGLEEPEAAWAVPLARLASVLDGSSIRRLRGSRRLEQRCADLRWGWRLLGCGGPDPAGLTEMERLQLHGRLEHDWPALLLALPLAEARISLARWRDADDPLHHPRAPIDGRSLQRSLALAPGPRLGALLHHLTHERAFGRLPDGADPLVAARDWLKNGPARDG